MTGKAKRDSSLHFVSFGMTSGWSDRLKQGRFDCAQCKPFGKLTVGWMTEWQGQREDRSRGFLSGMKESRRGGRDVFAISRAL